jgi:pentatricopeptide repeat protein
MRICNGFSSRQVLRLSKTSKSFSLQQQQQQQHHTQRIRRMTPNHDEFESLFIKALVKAGSCRNWSKNTPITKSRSYSKIQNGITTSEKKQLAGMLDYYDTFQDLESIITQPKNNDKKQNDQDKEMGEEKEEEEEENSSSLFTVSRRYTKCFAIPVEEMINDPNSSSEDIFELYQTLPAPGVMHLSNQSRIRLLTRLSNPTHKDYKKTLKFLSVLDDLEKVKFRIPRKVWNSAIHLVGRSIGRTTTKEVEQALLKWKEMEQEAGIQGDVVTFNILLDIAVKAGQYSLANMVLEEMEERNIKPDRFTRVGMIYFCGMKGDGDGIRKAYLDLINEDQVIDTPVLNCVITALLMANEPNAAEQVYDRLRDLYLERTDRTIIFQTRKSLKATTRAIIKQVKESKSPKEIERLQEKHFLAPDTTTFIILVKHHVTNTGELAPIVRYLYEMQALGVPIHGRIYLELFRGFAWHGGVRYTTWSQDHLNSVWEAFLELTGIENVYWDKWMVIWILRAFVKCSGYEAAIEIWKIIKEKWDPYYEEYEEMMLGIIQQAVHKKNSII